MVYTENRKWVLYVHTNKVNGKKYVGITSMNPEKRWGANGVNYKRSPHFYLAIKKYGWDNFEHKIIANNLSKSEATSLEVFYIHLFNSRDRKHGYNISTGGESGAFGVSQKGKRLSEETKRKISESHKGKKLSKETIIKSTAHSKGHKMSEKTRKVLEICNKTRIRTEKEKHKNMMSQPSRITVCQYTKKGEYIRQFNSLMEASRLTGADVSVISKCIKGKSKTAGGFVWKVKA